MKAILYHRVSTVDQDADLAHDQLYAAAAQRGMEVASYLREVGSGARNDRPGLQRVMQRVREGGIAAVLVWKLDRFGRSTVDLLSNIRELGRVGVRFIATSQGLDIGPGGDAVSQLLLTMLAAVSEFERELISERTHAGLEKARRRGRVFGRPRAPNAPQPELVKILRGQGHSWMQIANGMGCTVSAARRAFERPSEPIDVVPLGAQTMIPGTKL